MAVVVGERVVVLCREGCIRDGGGCWGKGWWFCVGKDIYIYISVLAVVVGKGGGDDDNGFIT